MKHLIVLASLTAGLVAQAQTYTAHPIDNLNSSTSQNIPIAGNSTSWDEARSHFLFLPQFLPQSPAVLNAIEFVPNTTYATPYERFEIWLDHTQNTSLSTTFANNLSAAPQLVYSRSPGSISWVGGTWTTLVLDTPFVYDGQSSLVMEIRKKMDRPNNPPTTAVSHRILTYPRRNDIPTPIWAYGTYGSGSVDAPTATSTYNTQILTRLVWLGGPPTTTIDSTRDTSLSTRAYFHIGATMTITTQGTPGELFVQAIDLNALLPVGVPVPGFAGELWLMIPTLSGLGILDAAGIGSSSLTLPSDPALVGLRAYFQSGTVNASGAVTLANVVDAPVAAY